MNKISCNIVRDLLPLYVDGVVSEETKKELEQHLRECPKCKTEYEQLSQELTLPANPDLHDESAHALKNMKHALAKKRVIVAVVSVITTLLMVAVLYAGFNYSIIFQRGNPVPYLTAASKISHETPFVKVNDNSTDSDVYITKNDMDSTYALLEHIEREYDVEFNEQYGSAFLFESEAGNLTISQEVYWGRFKVWSVPQNIDKPTSDKQ